jgi:hypothetical protein
MPDEKKNGLGLLISMGGPKMKADSAMESDDTEEVGTTAFDDAADEVFSALKMDDAEGFKSALKLALESIM